MNSLECSGVHQKQSSDHKEPTASSIQLLCISYFAVQTCKQHVSDKVQKYAQYICPVWSSSAQFWIGKKKYKVKDRVIYIESQIHVRVARPFFDERNQLYQRLQKKKPCTQHSESIHVYWSDKSLWESLTIFRRSYIPNPRIFSLLVFDPPMSSTLTQTSSTRSSIRVHIEITPFL